MLHNEIKAYLENWEREKKTFSSSTGKRIWEQENEQTISEMIKKILTECENKGYKQTKEDVSEWMAFGFRPNHPSDKNWGTYYGPMCVFQDRNTRQMIEYPSIQKVDQEVLEYWAKRAKECENPILSSRYADLVVDFSPKILNRNADIGLFQTVIDSNIAICENSSVDSSDCITKIQRALGLAIRVGDQERIVKVKDAIIKLEGNIAKDHKPGLWGFAFELLVLGSTGKVCLDEAERKRIVGDLEERLKRVARNPRLAEKAVYLLAEYYAKEKGKEEENLMRILGVFEKSLKSDQLSNSSAMFKVPAYEQIFKLYGKYANQSYKARGAKRRILKELGQLNPDWRASMKEVLTPVKIDRKNIDDVVDRTFGSNGQDELKVVMGRVAREGLPKMEEIKKQFDEILEKYSIESILPQTITLEGRLPIAQYEGVIDDYDSHFKGWVRENLEINRFLLPPIIDGLKKRFPQEEIIEYFEMSTVFKYEEKEYLKRAIASYWSDDYLISSHLFVSLIESGIRKLVEICDGQYTKPNKKGGYEYYSLGTLLGNEGPKFEEMFPEIGDDLFLYFSFVLTEKLGFNLRNDIAHGINKGRFLNREISDRLFHILICLSMVERLNKPD